MDHTETKTGEGPQTKSSPNWTIDVSDIRTIKVSNVSLIVSKNELYKFFSFSGDILYIDLQRESETTQAAYVTFRDSQGPDRATLLTGSTIAGLSVSITPIRNYQLPPNAGSLTSNEPKPGTTGSAVKKAEDVVSTMLAKGLILGMDAVASIDRKMGLREKLSVGTAVVNEKVKEMDEVLQVSEMTKSALVAAKQKASSAGSAIMSNHYMSTGASWVRGALHAVSRAAKDVGVMTKEKAFEYRKESNNAIPESPDDDANRYKLV